LQWIEPWCIENCLENAQLNEVKLTAIHSDCVPQDQGLFDVVIANINRNVLIEQLKDYRKVLNDSGVLLMSGFYKEDLEHIEKKCVEYQFKFSEFYELDGWIGVKYVL
jgi:ribosomal protein L11 methyltransferase